MAERLTKRTQSGYPDIEFSRFPTPRQLMAGYAVIYIRLCEFEDAEEQRNKNEPLTLDELREMDGRDWIWIEVLKPFDSYYKASAYYQRQEVGTAEYAMKKTFWCGYPGITFGFDYCDYGKTWLAYRYKPKEAAQ